VHRADDVDQSIRFSSLSGALFADAENRGRVLQRYVISRILRNNWQVAKSKRETVEGWEAIGLDLNSEQMTIGKRELLRTLKANKFVLLTIDTAIVLGVVPLSPWYF